MKQSRKSLAINILTWILSFLVILGVITLTLYFYPRDIVGPTTTETTLTEYRVGDTVWVKGFTTVGIDGRVDNVVTLQCGVATYPVRTISFPVQKQAVEYEIPLGDIPDGTNASPPRCRIVNYGRYHFKYFLNFERDYQVIITSNEFDIIK